MAALGAEEYRVGSAYDDADGDDQYNTIQAAVNAASDDQPTTITVESGEYGDIDIGTCDDCATGTDSENKLAYDSSSGEDAFGSAGAKTLTIRAAEGAYVRVNPGAAAAFRTDGIEAGVEIANNEGKSVTIEGIVFMGSEYGVAVKSGSDVTIRNNAFMNSLDDSSETTNESDIFLKDHVKGAGDGNPGVVLRDEGNYWGSTRTLKAPDSVAARLPSQSKAPEKSPSVGESSGILYDKTTAKEENRLVENNVGGPSSPIFVDKDIGNNDRIVNASNPTRDVVYRTLTKAFHDAAPETEIKVRPVSGTNGYDSSTINAEAVSGRHSLDIRGIQDSSASKLPVIPLLRFTKEGDYTVRNIQVREGIIATGSGVSVDARENYWLRATQPTAQDVTASDNANIEVEPYCVDAQCTGFDTSTNLCLKVVNPSGATTQKGCGGGSTSTITTTALTGITERPGPFNYEATVEVTGTVSRNIELAVDILPADKPARKSVTLTPSDSTELLKYSFSMKSIESQGTRNVEPHLVVRPQSATVSASGSFSSVALVNPSTSQPNETIDAETEQISGSKLQQAVFQSVTKEQISPVTAFNDGDDVDERLEDSVIPPQGLRAGQRGVAATGNVITEETESFRLARNPGGRGTVMLPNSNQKYEIGTRISSIPDANTHLLVLQYALQSDDKNLSVRVVNQGNSLIDQESGVREIDPTTNGDFLRTETTESVSTRTKVIELTESERQFINDRGYLNVVFRGDFDTSSSAVIFGEWVRSLDRDIDIGNPIPPSPTPTPPSPGDPIPDGPEVSPFASKDAPGTFSIGYLITDNKNSVFKRYDVRPYTKSDKSDGESITYNVRIQNSGDTAIRKEFGLKDIWQPPRGSNHYPGDKDINASTQTRIVNTTNVTVRPKESKTVPISVKWPATRFGNHTTRVVEIADDGSAIPIQRPNSDRATAPVYVLQPATFKITEARTPDTHLTHDNFNAEIYVKNIGDLSGTKEITASYGNWSSNRTVSLSGGSTRRGDDSSEELVSWARDKLANDDKITDFARRDYAPQDQQIPTESIQPEDNSSYPITEWFETGSVSYGDSTDNRKFRADAPFHTTTGNYSFDITTENSLNRSSLSSSLPPNVSNAMTDNQVDTVDLYKLKIIGMEVRVSNDFGIRGTAGASRFVDFKYKTRPNYAEGSYYASAFPYMYKSREATRIQGQQESPLEQRGTGTTRSIAQGSRLVSRTATPLGTQELSDRPSPVGFGPDVNNQFAYDGFTSTLNRKCGESHQSIQDSDSNVSITDPPALPTTPNASVNNVSAACSGANAGVRYPQLMRLNGTTTTGGLPQAEDLEYQGSSDDYRNRTILTARVGIQNPNSVRNAVGRVKVVSDKAGSGSVGLGESVSPHQSGIGYSQFDDNVVGVASAPIPPKTTKFVDVPIIIRNDNGQTGTHVLEVQARTSPNDYIEQTNNTVPPSQLGQSEITSSSSTTTNTLTQFQVPINVKGYGDVVLEDIGPKNKQPTYENDDTYNYTIQEVCTSNPSRQDTYQNATQYQKGDVYDEREGLNLVSGVISSGGGSGPGGVPFKRYGSIEEDGECRGGSSTTGSSSSPLTSPTSPPSTGTSPLPSAGLFNAKYTNYGSVSREVNSTTISNYAQTGNGAFGAANKIHERQATLSADRPFIDDNQGAYLLSDSTIQDNNTETGRRSISLSPGEEFTYQLSKRFEEPGQYRVLTSPCRQVDEEAPQSYDLEGFAGVYDSPSSDKTVIEAKNSVNTGDIEPGRTVKQSNYHGGGCDWTSVFVEDVTTPAPDFTIIDDTFTTKQPDEFNDLYQTVDNTEDPVEARSRNDNDDYVVHEGALLEFSSNSRQYPQSTQTSYATNWWNGGDAADNVINESKTINTSNSFLSSDNINITRMQWRFGGNGDSFSKPNYGSSVLTTNTESRCKRIIDTSLPSNPLSGKSCYIQAPENGASEPQQANAGVAKPVGWAGNNVDDEEHTAHRFYRAGNKKIKLSAWDNPVMTNGSTPNRQTVTHDITVRDDSTVPTVQASGNDQIDFTLSLTDRQYASSGDTTQSEDTATGTDSGSGGAPVPLGSSTNDTLVVKSVTSNLGTEIGQEHVFHQNGVAFDVESGGTVLPYADYGGEFDGGEVCASVNPFDPQIGITQDMWDFSDADGRNDHNVAAYTDADGDKRCWRYDEKGPSLSGDRDRRDQISYTALDAATNEVSHSATIQVISDDKKPLFDSSKFEVADRSDNTNGLSGDKVYIPNSDYNYEGGTLGIAADARDIPFTRDGDIISPVGLACLDFVYNQDKQTNSLEDCEKRSPDDGTKTLEFDQERNLSELNEGVLTSRNYGTDTLHTRQLETHATDLHSNSNKTTGDVTLVKDQTRPTVDVSITALKKNDGGANSPGAGKVWGAHSTAKSNIDPEVEYELDYTEKGGSESPIGFAEFKVFGDKESDEPSGEQKTGLRTDNGISQFYVKKRTDNIDSVLGYDKSNSGTATITAQVTDLHGNVGEGEASFQVREDTSDPTGSDKTEKKTDGSEASVSIDKSHFSDSGTGVAYLSGDTDVSADAPDANATSCGGRDSTGPVTEESTVTAYDYHGNTGTATIKATSSDSDIGPPCSP